MKKQIADNEKKMEENTKKLGLLQTEIEAQTILIDGIKAKQLELK